MIQAPPTQRQIEEARQRAIRKFETSLVEMILRSPEVHMLSSVAIHYDNGVATISGLVANKESVTKAGEILLTAPGVKKVKNELTAAE